MKLITLTIVRLDGAPEKIAISTDRITAIRQTGRLPQQSIIFLDGIGSYSVTETLAQITAMIHATTQQPEI